jgi:hypothetical protein
MISEPKLKNVKGQYKIKERVKILILGATCLYYWFLNELVTQSL